MPPAPPRLTTSFAAGGMQGDAMRIFGWQAHEMLAHYGASPADERACQADTHRRLLSGDRL